MVLVSVSRVGHCGLMLVVLHLILLHLQLLCVGSPLRNLFSPFRSWVFCPAQRDGCGMVLPLQRTQPSGRSTESAPREGLATQAVTVPGGAR